VHHVITGIGLIEPRLIGYPSHGLPKLKGDPCKGVLEIRLGHVRELRNYLIEIESEFPARSQAIAPLMQSASEIGIGASDIVMSLPFETTAYRYANATERMAQ
jgi:hypothetical protein